MAQLEEKARLITCVDLPGDNPVGDLQVMYDAVAWHHNRTHHRIAAYVELNATGFCVVDRAGRLHPYSTGVEPVSDGFVFRVCGAFPDEIILPHRRRCSYTHPRLELHLELTGESLENPPFGNAKGS